MMEEARTALTDLGQDFDWIVSQEEEPGSRQRGLGRLAACYLDSLATLGVLAVGHGIRYEFGIFDHESSTARRSRSPTIGSASATLGNRAA